MIDKLSFDEFYYRFGKIKSNDITTYAFDWFDPEYGGAMLSKEENPTISYEEARKAAESFVRNMAYDYKACLEPNVYFNYLDFYGDMSAILNKSKTLADVFYYKLLSEFYTIIDRIYEK